MRKIKTVNKKIEQNKAQYNLDKQAAKVSTLSSGNVGKHELLTVKDILPEEILLERAAIIKIFEYLSLFDIVKDNIKDIRQDL